MDEMQFRKEALEKGYDEVVDRIFEPHFNDEMHTHEFSVIAFVTEGEFILVTEDGENRYKLGDSCELVVGTLHTERTDSAGAKLLLSRK